MVRRVATALVGIPVLIAAIWLGGPWFAALTILAMALGIREFFNLAPQPGSRLPVCLGIIWVAAMAVGGLTASGPGDYLLTSAALYGAGAFLALLWLTALAKGPYLKEKAAYLTLGPLYVGFLLSHALLLRDLGDGGSMGRDWVLFALFATFATDTGAFLVGKSIGRHPMAPGISPNKTWEGALGGFLLATAAGGLLPFLLELELLPWQPIIISATVGVVSQLGDLLESKLKRISGVKDTGSIIPGHGGILDRLDSLLFSIPVTYYLVTLVFLP